MIKKTVTYEDFNGLKRTEDFYFNLTEAELLEIQVSTGGNGVAEMMRKMIDANDMPAILAFFKDFVLRAYGEKSLDGRRFMKNDEIREGFAQTNAYPIIFMELATNDKAAAEFVNGVIPQLKKN